MGEPAALALRNIQAKHPGRGEVCLNPYFAGHMAWHLTSQAAAAHNRWTTSAFAKLATQEAYLQTPLPVAQPLAGATSGPGGSAVVLSLNPAAGWIVFAGGLIELAS